MPMYNEPMGYEMAYRCDYVEPDGSVCGSETIYRYETRDKCVTKAENEGWIYHSGVCYCPEHSVIETKKLLQRNNPAYLLLYYELTDSFRPRLNLREITDVEIETGAVAHLHSLKSSFEEFSNSKIMENPALLIEGKIVTKVDSKSL